jgi:hypothetical protein
MRARSRWGHQPVLLATKRPPGPARFRAGLPMSAFEFGEQTKQIATQPATVAIGDPCGVRSIERLGDGIRRHNYV